MQIKELDISGVYLVETEAFQDNRGIFFEWFRKDILFENTKIDFTPVQANLSVSKINTIRGIHFSLSQFGQSKLVTCPKGAIWDVVVDIRPNSPTFKKWISIELNAESGYAILVSGKLGHSFFTLKDESVVTYILDSYYDSNTEYSINPLDSELSIAWPTGAPLLSNRDRFAPTLNELLVNNKLPLDN